MGGQSGGRRAASQADVEHQTSSVTDAEEDMQEKDALLSQVEAGDLIEFGMIPVRFLTISRFLKTFYCKFDTIPVIRSQNS